VALTCSLAAQGLPERIDHLIQGTPAAASAFWGIQIVDLASGKTIYEQNAHRFFVPASNTKLFTTAMALVRLGPDYTFSTIVTGAAPDAQGRVEGPLRLIGHGDPNLSARAIPYRPGAQPPGNPLAAIEELAGQVAARGVKRVAGDIIGDDTWYVWEPYAAGWGIEDPKSDDGAPISALTVADNGIVVGIRPGAREGEIAALTLNPPIEYYRIDNRIRTAAAGSERRIHFDRLPGSLDARLWGSVPLRDTPPDFVIGIEDPAQYAAMALREALENRGITVEGSAVAEHLRPSQAPDLLQGSAAAPTPGVELARHESAPLLEDLRITDKVSQNLHAELDLRAVGRARRNVGSFEAGLEELKIFLNEAGIAPETYNIRDGSGLARLNLVTPATVMKLLRYMYASPLRDTWIPLLPIGGRDGTLNTRFGDSPVVGRVHAKTGSLGHVSALSGYIQRPNGEWVAFSILVNNYNSRTPEIRGIMDRICTLIIE
jgi:D-alanyl-D-alanine carboxypeptidase/D-alanyl-D-alanine-endopeptidase (penicillin-binding protein 4)